MVRRLKLFFVLILFISLMNFSFISAVGYTNKVSNKVSCTDIFGGSDSNFCIDSTGAPGSGITWAEAINGTLALNSSLADYVKTINWNATNTSYRETRNHTFYNSTNVFFGINTSTPKNTLNVFGDINVSGDGSQGDYGFLFDPNRASSIQFNISADEFYFNVNGLPKFMFDVNGNIGINTTTPQNILNVVGDINATTTIWSYGLNLTTGYGYALNSTNTFTANYTNFSTIYAGLLGNASNITTIYGNQLGNASNMTTLYSNQYTNWTGGPWQNNASNFSTLYMNQFNNYTNVNFNQTNFSVIYAYALNDSRWSLNYSNYSIGWLYATNSTATARTLNSSPSDLQSNYTLPMNKTAFTLAVSASTNYTYGCKWIVNSSLATVGFTINVSVPASPTYFSAGISNPTSAVATNYTSCSGTAVQCLSNATSSSAVSPVETTINGRLENGVNAGIINFTFGTEINGSQVRIKRASYCWIQAEV